MKENKNDNGSEVLRMYFGSSRGDLRKIITGPKVGPNNERKDPSRYGWVCRVVCLSISLSTRPRVIVKVLSDYYKGFEGPGNDRHSDGFGRRRSHWL